MSDEFFMSRALELAEAGLGNVSPNPMVGCVIVCDDRIIGEGYHERYGSAHAEVNAINSVEDQSLLSKSTLYVNLEPCAHYGKTPPCADLIVKHQLSKVVISNEDPNPLVSGKGIERLKNSGIEVKTGVLKNTGKELNKRFFTSQLKMRPYLILKWAETKDGFIARENFDSKWISNPNSRQLVHKWRSEEDAIMVGTNTARHDNPLLTVRDWEGRNPVRVVIDKRLALDPKLNLFDGTVKTFCFTEIENQGEGTPSVEYIYLPELTNGLMLNELSKRGIQSMIIEGGSKLLQTFIDLNLWDEARVFVGEKTFGSGISAPRLRTSEKTETKIFEDRLMIYTN